MSKPLTLIFLEIRYSTRILPRAPDEPVIRTFILNNFLPLKRVEHDCFVKLGKKNIRQKKVREIKHKIVKNLCAQQETFCNLYIS